jgi:hypothetical protein
LVWLFFEIGVSNDFPGWPQITILPISASQVARITGLSHQHPANSAIFIDELKQSCHFTSLRTSNYAVEDPGFDSSVPMFVLLFVNFKVETTCQKIILCFSLKRKYMKNNYFSLRILLCAILQLILP